ASSLTLSTLVHGAWALLLREYTHEEDVVYGAVVSGRSAEVPRIEETVGLLNNLLPVRPPIPLGSSTLRRWLQDSQASFLEIRGYEHRSLDEVITWSEVPPACRLFESYIVFENMPVDKAIAGTLDPATPLSLVQLEVPLRVEVWPGPRLLFI